MIKLVKRTTPRASSPVTLAERITYISDPTHPDHQGKTIHPARNYNCPDHSPLAFQTAVQSAEDDYRNARAGKRGKRSPRLYEEVIYSSPHGANLTALERESVETMIVNLIGRRTACRTAWHVDEDTGRADLHIFLAAKTHDYPPKVTLWADFGGSEGRHIYAEFDKLDSLITRQLNRNPDRKKRLKSADKVRKEKASYAIGKKTSLAAEIAAKAKGPVSADNIAEVVTALDHTVSKLTTRSISVIFSGRVKPRRFNLDDLLANVAAERDRLSRPTPQGPQDRPEMA